MSTPLVEIRDLRKYFNVKATTKTKGGQVKAVDGVNLVINEGETLGLVGESGCGKSTLGRAILKLDPPTGGEILYQGNDITKLSVKEMRPYRAKMQIVFQDPFASLNPRKTIYQSVVAPLELHKGLTEKEKQDRVSAALREVGMAEKDMQKYPHELSGGQRQRIVIARALISKPNFIVCDEPVSALDVSVRAQVLNLLSDLQKKNNLTYLFISHDLSVVQYLCNRVAVMYLGCIIELADTAALFKQPLHPYTQALLSAIPVPDIHHKKQEIILEGEVPSPLNHQPGCRFHTRCPYATERCRTEQPMLEKVDETRSVACHRYKEIAEGKA